MDSSQPTPPANAPVDSAQVQQQPVTAAGSTPVDNATNPPVNTQGPPQTVVGGQTAAGVDDEPMMMGDAEYEAEKAAFLAATPPGPQKSALEQMASPADLAAQGLPVPGVTDTAPPVASTPPAPTTQSGPVTAVPPVPEDDLAPQDGKLPRFNNVRATDAVDVQALAAFKAAQKSGTLGGKSMVQFMADFAQKAALGTPAGEATSTPPANVSTPPTSSTTTAPQPGTVAAVDAERQRLREERYKALELFDFAKAAEIERQEDTLRAQREDLRVAEVQQAQQREQSMASADEQALAKAAALFPQAVDGNGALAQKMSEIYAGWEAGGDPRTALGNRYLYAYMEAAEALGITPQASGAAPVSQPVSSQTSVQPTTSTPAPVHRPPTAALLASGGARDIPRAPVSEKLDDYEAEKAAFLGLRKAA